MHQDENFIDTETFDMQQRLAKEWERNHNGGKLPDRIGYLLSEIRREWYRRSK